MAYYGPNMKTNIFFIAFHWQVIEDKTKCTINLSHCKLEIAHCIHFLLPLLPSLRDTYNKYMFKVRHFFPFREEDVFHSLY